MNGSVIHNKIDRYWSSNILRQALIYFNVVNTSSFIGIIPFVRTKEIVKQQTKKVNNIIRKYQDFSFKHYADRRTAKLTREFRIDYISFF